MAVRLKIFHKGLILIALPLLCELIFVVSLAVMLQHADQEVEYSSQSKTIVAEINIVTRLYLESMSHLFAYGKTRNDAFLHQFQRCKKEINDEIDLLRKLCATNSLRHEKFLEFEAQTKKSLRLLDVSESMLVSNKQDLRYLAYDWRQATSGLLTDLQDRSVDLANIEHKTFRSDPNNTRVRSTLRTAFIWGVLANFVVAIILLLWFTKNWVHRLNILADNSQRLAAEQPLLAIVDGSDEIAQVDEAFHRMAESLSTAMRKERAILENARELICSIDRTGCFTAANPASLAFLSLPAQELIGKNFAWFANSIEFQSIVCDKQNIVWEGQLQRTDGTAIDTLWSITCSSADEIYYCVAHDVTEQKQVERLKKEVVAMVSHDLRSPLTSVGNFLSMLSIGVFGEVSSAAMSSCHTAERNVKRLIALINDLLDMEKMEAGKLQLSLDVITLSSVVPPAIEVVEGLADGHKLVWNNRQPSTELFADRDRLLQVLINLLSNAIKFFPPESTIAVETLRSDTHIEFRVCDRGKGIPAELRQKIFNRFEQVNTADAQLHHGTGLGLAIAKKIVELHAGEIGVSENDGGGSIFWFKIPCEPTPNNE